MTLDLERQVRAHAAPPIPSLAPVLSPHGRIPPSIEMRLDALAAAARDGDAAARNALYLAFRPRLAPALARERRRLSRPWTDPAFEPEDVDQEAFLVFARLIDTWPGDDAFVPYLLGRFPLRLRDAFRDRSGSRGRLRATYAMRLDADDPSAAADAALVVLAAVAEAFPSPDREILLWRVRDGERFETVASRLGLSVRQVLRRWQSIRSTLRQSLAGRGGSE